ECWVPVREPLAAQMVHSLRVLGVPRHLHPFPTRRSSDLLLCSARISGRREYKPRESYKGKTRPILGEIVADAVWPAIIAPEDSRSEEHTSELQSRENLVCRLLLQKNKAQSGRSELLIRAL